MAYVDEAMQGSRAAVDLQVGNVGKEVHLHILAAQGMKLAESVWEAHAETPHKLQMFLQDAKGSPSHARSYSRCACILV